MDRNWRVHVNNTVAFQGYYTKVGIIDRKCNRRTIRDEHLHEPRRYDLQNLVDRFRLCQGVDEIDGHMKR